MIRVLGPVVVDNSPSGEPLNPRLRRLLARLAVRRGETVPETALIDALWDEGELPANPTRSLQTYVSRLRSQLGAGSIERVAAGYRLVDRRLVSTPVTSTVFWPRLGRREIEPTIVRPWMHWIVHWRCGRGRRWEIWPMRRGRWRKPTGSTSYESTPRSNGPSCCWG